MFDASDANGDGLLDLAEYTHMMEAFRAKQVEKGLYVDPRPNYIQDGYALGNRITPGTDGISYEEFQIAGGVIMKKMQELKAEGGFE